MNKRSATMFKEEREEAGLEWAMPGDAAQARPNLGSAADGAVSRRMPFALRDIRVRKFGAVVADRVCRFCAKRAA